MFVGSLHEYERCSVREYDTLRHSKTDQVSKSIVHSLINTIIALANVLGE